MDTKSVDMDKLARKVTKQLTDSEKIIEGGWRGGEEAIMPLGASSTQRKEMRKAFFGGAQHLFASIMCVMDSGREPTERDLERMIKIHNELEAFKNQMLLDVVDA